jgi:hypothetical protein
MNDIDFGLFTFTLTARANQGEKLVALVITGKINPVSEEKVSGEPDHEINIPLSFYSPLTAIRASARKTL